MSLQLRFAPANEYILIEPKAKPSFLYLASFQKPVSSFNLVAVATSGGAEFWILTPGFSFGLISA
jgi:hypothetical protein